MSAWRLGRPRRLLGGAALVVVAWLGACALLLLGARHDAAAGLDSVNAARRLTAPDELLAGVPVRPLEAARRSFRSAHRRLDHPVLAPLKLVPVLGRQLRSATAIAGAAADVADVGVSGVVDARRALEQPHGTGPERIALLRRLHDVADRAERRLAGVRLGPSHALLGVIADKRVELVDKLASVRAGLHDASVASSGLADLLTGPRRYLVLAANNAEMRAGAGQFLSAGELTVADGTLNLGELRWTGSIQIPPEQAPPIDDADLAGRWGLLNPNREWRNLSASPRFAASAQLAARMWPLVGGAPVDGVLALDPLALRALLTATGSVDAGGRSVNADNVVGLLLHDQYASLPEPGAHFDVAQAARRDSLGQIARSVIGRLSEGPFEVGTLAGSLADAARGRHLLAWSSKPGDQAAWESAGIDGSLTPASAMVSVLNRGGNKLDHFMATDATLKVAPNGASSLTIALHNDTPEGENIYVAGPYPGSGAGAGEYTGVLAVDLPLTAGDITVDGFDRFLAAGRDGPVQVVGVPVTVKRGQTTTVVLHFNLPRRGSFTVEPSARFPATTWHVPGAEFRDSERHEVRWG